MLQLVGGKSVK